jgi:hypothetical protein
VGGDSELARHRSSPESSIVLGVLLVGYGLFVLGRLLRDWFGATRTGRFVATRGRVLGVQRGTTRVRRSRSVAPPIVGFHLRVRYSYDAAGTERVGTRYGYGRIGRKEWQAARALLEAQQEGDEIEVWYDPLRPDDAVVVRGYVGPRWRELAWSGATIAAGAVLICRALQEPAAAP